MLLTLSSTSMKLTKRITQQDQHGFSLIELFIVVAVVGIISAIAVPNLIASRRAANESNAVSGLRVISSAEHTFHASVSIGRYGTAAEMRDAKLIDATLAGEGAASTGGTKSGFLYTITPGNDSTYTATAAAQNGQASRSFFVDESSVIRYLAGGTPPTAATGTPIPN